MAAPAQIDQLFQWANEDLKWQTGNLGQSNSEYFEGDFVPYYVSFSNLTVGSTYTVTIEWDTTQGGKHALDYIGTYDASYSTINPAAQEGLADTVADDTYAIPLDTFMSAQWNVGSTQDPGVFTIWNGDITALSNYTTPLSYAGNTSTSITLTFVATDDDVVLAWSGHIASREDWGFNNSAVAISGSPYHMRIDAAMDVTANPDVSLGGAGQTDRSLSSDAVTFPASITVIKDATDPFSSQVPTEDFTFLITGPNGFSQTFTLDDDDGDGEYSNTITFPNMTDFGAYTITETSIPQFWDLASILVQQVDPVNGNTSTLVDPAPVSNAYTITLTEGDAWTLTFNDTSLFNADNVQIAIEKRTLDGTTTALGVAADFATASDGPMILVGNDVTWIYKVTNPGDYPLSSVAVTDSVPGVSPTYLAGDANENQVLDLTETWYFTATDADADMGSYSNVGTASGTFNNVTPTATDGSSYYGAAPAIELLKSGAWVDGDADGYADVGELISYTFTVTNTGNVTLTNVTVTDPLVTVVGGPLASLAVGASDSTTFTGSYVITQDDIDAGSVYNLATTTGTPPVGGDVSDTDDNIAPLPQNPELMLDKTGTFDAGGDGYANVGELITYTFTVTNTGNVTLHNVFVSDPLPGMSAITPTAGDGDSDGDVDVLAVGASATFSATYAVTQADIDAGSVVNLATADSDESGPDDDDHTETLPQNPLIDIVKVTVYGAQSGDGLTGVMPGDPIKWQYTVTNIGNVTLTNVTVTDDNGTPADPNDDFPATKVSGDSVFEPGDSWVFEATGVAVSGPYGNIGTAAGTSGQTTVTDSDPSSYVGIYDTGQITPTGTTCDQYISGTAQDFEDYYASQGGHIEYAVKDGVINSTNPGVFFYWTGLSNTIVGTDGNADGAPDPISVVVDQSDDNTDIGPFTFTKSDVKLYKITDDGDGIIDAGDTCTAVTLASSQIQLGTGSNLGDVTVTFTPDAVGSLYVLSVKYDTGSVKGTSVDLPYPTVHYSFTTNVNGGPIEETDSGGIDLAPKASGPTATTLAGSTAPVSGFSLASSADPGIVVGPELLAWASASSGAGDLLVTDLGRSLLDSQSSSLWLEDMTARDTIDLDAVDLGRLDLLSSVAARFEQPLAVEHNVMGAAMQMNDAFIAPDIGLLADIRHLPIDQMYAS